MLHSRTGFLFALLSLSACSLSSVIGSNSVDYNQTIEYVTNDMLVTNILRARDEVPLYFTDLSHIRGSLQLGTTAAVSVPFGNADVANQRTRRIASATLSVSTAPTFDIAPLDDTIFSEGLLKPVDPAFLQAYLAQGVSQKLLLRLLVEKIEFLVNSEPHISAQTAICSYENTPFVNLLQRPTGSPAAAETGTSPCPPRGLPPDLATFDQLLDLFTLPIIVHKFTKLTPFGPPFRIDGRPLSPGELLRGGASCCANAYGGQQSGEEAQKSSGDAQKGAGGGGGGSSLSVRPAPGRPGEFQIFKSSSQITICLPNLEALPPNVATGYGASQYSATNDAPDDACFKNEAAPERIPVPINIYLRSAQGILAYLGQVLRIEKRNQMRMAQGLKALPLPTWLNFFIWPGYSASARFNLTYDGDAYHVDNSSPGDNTLQILSILNQLLNTIKSASEIPTTQAVQALP